MAATGILVVILSHLAFAKGESTAKPLGQAGKGPLKVFILAGQSNIDGQANHLHHRLPFRVR